MHRRRFSYLFLCAILSSEWLYGYDATLVGRIRFSDGLCRIPITLIDMLKNDMNINFISIEPRKPLDLSDIPLAVKDLLQAHCNSLPSNVALFCDGLWYHHAQPISFLPESRIKIAYSMFETNKIPNKWVEILNTKFDAVAVPDPFLIEVYKNSGVTIPLFVVPCGLYLEEFLHHTMEKKKDKPFVFGMTGGFGPVKNHEKVIEAFHKAFGNSKKVQLRIHGRWGAYYMHLRKKIRSLRAKNIILTRKVLTQSELIDFMAKLDCYVLLSKGEGFSITPREAMALGIPCILSDNTAHKTICATGLVKAVNCPILEVADYSQVGLGGIDCGQRFNCTVEDAIVALKEVYMHYPLYCQKACQGREWVQQYEYKNLRKRYLNLLKPQNIILGNRNEVTDEYFMTSSIELYQKYQAVFKKNLLPGITLPLIAQEHTLPVEQVPPVEQKLLENSEINGQLDSNQYITDPIESLNSV